MKKAFVFYRSFYEALQPLSNDEKLELFNAICEYGLNQTITEMKPLVNAMFTLIKPQIEANNTRYDNGAKGGRPAKQKTEPKPNDNQNETEAKPKEKEKEKEKEKDKEYSKEFLELWSIYQVEQKGDKLKAYKSYLKNKINKVDTQVVINALEFEMSKSYGKRHLVTLLNNFKDTLEAMEDFKTTPKQQKKRFEDMTLEEKMEYNEQEKQRKIEANYGSL